MNEVISESTPLLKPPNENGNNDENNLKLETLRRIKNTSNERSFSKVLPLSSRIVFTWSNLNVFTKKTSKKSCWNCWKQDDLPDSQNLHLLKNVNGIACPGELLAILGPSGAGKTTLLNALTFRSSSKLDVTGLRCVNGIPASSTSFVSQSAYVQQEDAFIGTLTVREHLIFQALVRMDRNIPYVQRMIKVDEVISELGLTKCKDTIIGVPGRLKGISGGETKRLSFAAEVLTDPALMFCDEPTSGLDSFMALNVMQVLKNLSQSGKTIICTIHQPSSELYAMFDKLLFMTEGRVAFLGTPDEADLFFAELEAPCPPNYNPADYFIQLLSIVPGEEQSCKQGIGVICDRFERSDYGIDVNVKAATLAKSDYNYDQYVAIEEKATSPYKAHWCAQFRAVLWRSWMSITKEPLMIRVRLMQNLMTSLLIGMIYFGQELNQEGVMNINGVLFLFLTTMTFQNVSSVIHVFCGELPVFLKEHKNGMYRSDVYFLAKTIAEIPLFIVLPTIFMSICYFMIGLNPHLTKFLICLVVVVLTVNVSTSFGYVISCSSTSIQMALSMTPALIVPFLLFGGFFLNVRSIPIYFEWLSYISWFKYANGALMINQWADIKSITCPPNANVTCLRTGDDILQMYNFSTDDFIPDIIALIGLICLFRILAYLFLLRKTYSIE